jgi:hypothetical protein
MPQVFVISELPVLPFAPLVPTEFTGIEPTVIELNLDTVRRLREDGIRAVYGDAAHRETLQEAKANHARLDP